MEHVAFLERNRISQAMWEKASIAWQDLVDIKTDYESRKSQLEDAVEYSVKVIQGFKGVHSVRWRVKSADHLLEKIIRKRSQDKVSKKYQNIDASNYLSVVTDLIGVRALHLFKTDVLEIHPQIIDTWQMGEKPVSYVRAGDRSDLIDDLKRCGINSKVHDAGYRSVHCIIKMRPGIVSFFIELQVRTIFEEAWSEIDHKVRYPNFSENKQIEEVLTIFNRLSGGADELGGFIKGLSVEFDSIDEKIEKADRDRDQALEELQHLVSQLASVQEQNSQSSQKMALIQRELDNVKNAIKTGASGNVSDVRFFTDKDGRKWKVTASTNKRISRAPPPIRPLD
ncbi:hypothetical protein ALP45_00593 [Pseudomonas coronafaciens pv. atropurpurea]|uniref:RelA/SpoT domain-containing protein n=1 Tax=Pseudomonas coronafaciens TaxID=53409 RepID=UPI0006D61AED|nr:hypothetical protein [Pseudomonas coronafaciens]KPW31394.1 Uncharacterized protein ALO66_02612 [Pseudomonas coronafaciens pv. atropurpurea]RMT58388.1 hypothetical protein ALP45_00593 [Pseudomonas coronafaciens pv. atropurpurea]